MIIDIALCVLLVIITVTTHNRGALLSLRGLFSFAAGGIVSSVYTDTVTDFVYIKFVRGIYLEKIKQVVFSGKANEKGYEWSEFIKTAAEKSGKASDIAEYVTDHFLEPRIVSLVRFIVSIVLFLLVSWLVSFIIRKLTKAVKKHKATKGIDALLGAVFGFVAGSILVFSIAGILYMFGETGIDRFPELNGQIAESMVVRKTVDIVIPYVQGLIHGL